jgi:hypothetical protein
MSVYQTPRSSFSLSLACLIRCETCDDENIGLDQIDDMTTILLEIVGCPL